MGTTYSCVRAQERPIEANYEHFNLVAVPEEILGHEKFLRVLALNHNTIKDLPKSLFNFTQLVRLDVSDNEIETLSSNVANLVYLEDLDISRNGIADIPDDIRNCKYLRRIDVSANPIGRIPDGFTHLTALREIYLNDIFLEHLPDNIGNLSCAEILELRENQLTTLPPSISELKYLKRLDLGNNHFEDLSSVIGHLISLQELWLDCNALRLLPNEICSLTRLTFLDVSENLLEALPRDIHALERLEDLHANDNQLKQLPENFGGLGRLTVLKLENNFLVALPRSIGSLMRLTEFNVSQNQLQHFPPSIGFLHSLLTLIADGNKIMSLPPELGSCQSLTVLSLRNNNLRKLPRDIGRLANIVVLALSGNRLEYLPSSLLGLTNLSALWLSENQAKPLIPLQHDRDQYTGEKILTCFMFPQTGKEKLVGVPRFPYRDDVTSGGMGVSGQESKRNSTIMFNIQEEQQRTASNRSGQYPKDVIERHPPHHPPLHHPRQQQQQQQQSRSSHRHSQQQQQQQGGVSTTQRPLSYLRSVGTIDDYSEGEEIDVHRPLPPASEPHMNGGHVMLNNAIPPHMRSNPTLNPQNETYPEQLPRQPIAAKSSLQNVSMMEDYDRSGSRRRMASDSIVRTGHRGLPSASRPLWPEEVHHSSAAALAASGTGSGSGTSGSGIRQRPMYLRERQTSLPSLDQLPFRHHQPSSQHYADYDHLNPVGSSSRLDANRGGGGGGGGASSFPHSHHRLESPPPWWSSPSSSGDHLERRSAGNREMSPLATTGGISDPAAAAIPWENPIRKNGAFPNPMVGGVRMTEDSGHGTNDTEDVEIEGQIIYVDIVRDPRLGFSISGGTDSLGDPCRPKDTGVFVTKIASDGPAAMSGQLQIGDKILEVNGDPLLSVTHRRAIEVLQRTGKHVCLKIERLPRNDAQQGTLL